MPTFCMSPCSPGYIFPHVRGRCARGCFAIFSEQATSPSRRTFGRFPGRSAADCLITTSFQTIALAVTGHAVVRSPSRVSSQFTPFSRAADPCTGQLPYYIPPMGRPKIRPAPEHVEKICACGCKTAFSPFPMPIAMKNGGGYRYADYIVGHHPNGNKGQYGKARDSGWNRGLKKGDHPSLERMGFQRGHLPYTTWDHVNQTLKTDPVARARWIQSKKHQIPWNRGMTANTHPGRIPKADRHWNWRGNPNGARETHAYHAFRKSIFERDGYKCKQCGDHGHKGRGKTVKLHMHHIVPVCHDRSRVLDPANVITLCVECHRQTDTFGPKAMQKLRSYRERQ